MSKNIQGVMGLYKGKVGTIVGFIWKGLQLQRGLTWGSNPNTRPQRIIRSRFATIGALGGKFLDALQIGLKKYAQNQKSTEVGEFVKLNWAQVTATSPEAVTIDYTGLQIAKGGLKGVDFGNPQFDNPLEVAIDITPNTEAASADADDLVYTMLYCPDLDSVLMPARVTRSTPTITINVPNSWNGQRVYIYGFTVGDADNRWKGVCSDSAYIGSGTIS